MKMVLCAELTQSWTRGARHQSHHSSPHHEKPMSTFDANSLTCIPYTVPLSELDDATFLRRLWKVLEFGIPPNKDVKWLPQYMVIDQAIISKGATPEYNSDSELDSDDEFDMDDRSYAEPWDAIRVYRW